MQARHSPSIAPANRVLPLASELQLRIQLLSSISDPCPLRLDQMCVVLVFHRAFEQWNGEERVIIQDWRWSELDGGRTSRMVDWSLLSIFTIMDGLTNIQCRISWPWRRCALKWRRCAAVLLCHWWQPCYFVSWKPGFLTVKNRINMLIDTSIPTNVILCSRYEFRFSRYYTK